MTEFFAPFIENEGLANLVIVGLERYRNTRPKSKKPDFIHAPFTQDQVDALNTYQGLGYVHGYTCEKRSTPLVATLEGWRCEDKDCEYTQDWAHASHADKTQHPPPPGIK